MLTQYKLNNAKTILNKSDSPDEDLFIGTINPYTGCEHGCVYCYVQAQKYQPYKNTADLFKTIGIKQNAPALLEEQFLKGLPYGMLCIGSSSDPYQPAEKEHKITAKLLEVTAKYGFPVHIFTKSCLIERDLDILKSIAAKSIAVVSFSVITLNKTTAELFEKDAPPPQRRLETIAQLSKVGVIAGASIMPVLPYITDSLKQTEALIKAVKENGGKYVWPGCLTLRDLQKQKYHGALLKNYPGLASRYEQLYHNRHSPSQEYNSSINDMVYTLAKRNGLNMGLSFMKKLPRWGKGLKPLQKEFNF
ncbi:MAG: hypothetical protein A2252_03930 [Elusimicrobia bacterium RIFOXYA2_FULL_39_19]|nr:MAG: hypothetical protein A2252_03930 [Elusimicrobia bacterium RIFOXYA2_FULL_39_19]